MDLVLQSIVLSILGNLSTDGFKSIFSEGDGDNLVDSSFVATPTEPEDKTEISENSTFYSTTFLSFFGDCLFQAIGDVSKALFFCGEKVENPENVKNTETNGELNRKPLDESGDSPSPDSQNMLTVPVKSILSIYDEDTEKLLSSELLNELGSLTTSESELDPSSTVPLNENTEWVQESSYPSKNFPFGESSDLFCESFQSINSQVSQGC